MVYRNMSEYTTGTYRQMVYGMVYTQKRPRGEKRLADFLWRGVV